MGLTIIGMIGGSLITGLCMYIYYRKRVGVRCALQREIADQPTSNGFRCAHICSPYLCRISDNLGHTKFTDAPGT